MQPANPFDAADLDNLVEARHIMRWYAQLSESMRQRCVNTIQDNERMLEFLRNATRHEQHNPGEFGDSLIDLTRRMLEKLRQ